MFHRERRSRSELVGAGRVHLRQTKVQNLCVPAIRNKNVCRLDVAMNYPLRMCCIQCISNLDCEIEQTLDVQGVPKGQLAKCLALQELHYDERSAVALPDLMNGANIRMI